MSLMRIPIATYRLQFNPSFTFGDAKEVLSYLAELGISEIYASPIFKTRKGSTHGYDVVDFTQLSPELGGMEGFEGLIETVQDHGMGWLQDIIPNHMAYDCENQILVDVLENGPSSRYARFFDADWDHPYETMRGRLLAPFLGRFAGECLEDGKIQLAYGETGLTLGYYNLRFPLRIESYAAVLTRELDALKRKLGHDNPDFVKLLGVLHILKTLPSAQDANERYDQTAFVKKGLWELYTSSPEITTFIDANITAFNGQRGSPESFNLLDNLLAEQCFRLSFWKVATEEINYRRFFNINELISLRIEDRDVFDHTHSLIFRLVSAKKIAGLRIDHIDGLYNPADYLKRVRHRTGDLYVVVEKILAWGEELPSFWPVQGTTGYDFLNHVNGVFCKTEHERAFDRIYARFTGFRSSYEDLIAEKKRLIIGKHMAGDIDNLAHLMKKISGRSRHGSDITLYGLRRTLVEVMALFPVYRTYVSGDLFSDSDRSYIQGAVKRARQSNPGLTNELSFVENFLLLEFEDYLTEEEKRQWTHFVMRFQQFTGPLMAKGFEDTVLYVYNRLLSLNEVGGNPHKFGVSVGELHKFSDGRAQRWPLSLNATSTHDTKRGEDVRARINVLSEIPHEWNRAINRWTSLNRGKKKRLRGAAVPEKNDEYFLYQTLIGAFPLDEGEHPQFLERVKDYIVKAVREAKVHTAWLKPDTDYEEAFLFFVEEILRPSEDNRFLAEFLPFHRRVASYGAFSSLSQTLIKITSPGVPDFYQGSELWDLALVDPDNRRPVDFDKRRAVLRDIKEKAKADILVLIAELLSHMEDGRIKLFTIHRALEARKAHIELFQRGLYTPLEASGTYKDNVVTFARRYDHQWAAVLVPRFLTALINEGELPLGSVWADTHIPLPQGAPPCWTDALSGQMIAPEGSLSAEEAFRYFPGALLLSQEVQ
jgi:(1->4)-alpha-D-glucan 1-alpha-D-glucosylmutase